MEQNSAAPAPQQPAKPRPVHPHWTTKKTKATARSTSEDPTVSGAQGWAQRSTDLDRLVTKV